MSTVRFTDNSDAAIQAMSEAVEAALEAIGQQAVSHAKNNLTRAGRRDTGGAGLVGSISSLVVPSEEAVYVGTNTEYAPYHEYGTGKHAEGGGGRQGWWVYVPGSSGKATNPKIYTREEAAQLVAILRSRGIDAHMTDGIEPTHFLRNSVQGHEDEYKAISEQVIKAHQP